MVTAAARLRFAATHDCPLLLGQALRLTKITSFCGPCCQQNVIGRDMVPRVDHGELT